MTHINRLREIASTEMGWAHFNPGTGMEWSRDHPVNSGECDDAERIERMTYAAFVARHCKEPRT